MRARRALRQIGEGVAERQLNRQQGLCQRIFSQAGVHCGVIQASIDRLTIGQTKGVCPQCQR